MSVFLVQNTEPLPRAVNTQGGLAKVLKEGHLCAVFQPIVDLQNVSVYAHEALIRGPAGTPLHMPDALLRAAAQEQLSIAFEIACVREALQSWARLRMSGRLFVNISAAVLIQWLTNCVRLSPLKLISDLGLNARMVVLEITEHERVEDMDKLAEAVHFVRRAGVSLALDDFGDGRSSLRLWSQLKPEVVKIDKYFTGNISQHGDKLKTLQALQQIAAIFGTELVAEGIETQQDLRVLRDLGISYGQGYLLGRPHAQPLHAVAADVGSVLTENQIVVFPELSRAKVVGQLQSLHIVQAPTVTAHSTNDAVAALFIERPTLHALALVDGDRPVGIIGRTRFMNEYSKLYYRDVWGRKSCAMHVNYEPRLVEREHCVDELIGILTSQDQRYLSDGIIVIDNGRYAGLGTGDQLVRCVTEARIEAARHANPLTFLPGNIPISHHIERLLSKQVCFAACYADLNHFKPFNDYYGYWRGDEMIRLLARVAAAQCDSQRDFLGHVGGDDFIVLFQSPDWRERCERLVRVFNEQAFAMYDEAVRRKGGIDAEDRHGVVRFFPCTTVSVGAVVIEGGQFSRVEEVANLAAMAKHDAKQAGVGVWERVV